MKLVEMHEQDMMAVNGGWDPPSDFGPVLRVLTYELPDHGEDPLPPPDYRHQFTGSSIG